MGVQPKYYEVCDISSVTFFQQTLDDFKLEVRLLLYKINTHHISGVKN